MKNLVSSIASRLSLGANDTGVVARAVSFEEWSASFMMDRLWVVLWLGLIGNANFALADYLFHSEALAQLLLIRGVVQAILIVIYLLYRSELGRRLRSVWLMGFVWALGGAIAQMTVHLGGFSSSYYAGMNLVFVAAAVLVPVQLRTHVISQVGLLLYYFAVNAVTGGSGSDWSSAAENTFFLVWTCLISDVCVYLYTRLQRAEFDAHAELQTTLEITERERLRNEFYANVNHELRTPLTLILGGFRTLLKDPGREQRQDIVLTGLRNTSRLVLLINQMLDLARLDSGREVPDKRPVDFAALVRNVASNFESSSDRRRIHLRGVDRIVPAEVDIQQLKKVLYNLLSNAFKFSDPKEGQVWIHLRIIESQRQVELLVEDNGYGIPQDQLTRIFGRFSQARGAGARHVEGTGIGLALVNEIIKAHEGVISVESEVGRGTTFTVRFPQGDVSRGITTVTGTEDAEEMLDFLNRIAQKNLHHDRGLANTGESGPDPHASLLVVAEDNADLRSYLVRLLGVEFHVAPAEDGQVALDRVRELRPDLVITDVVMPRMSGHELLAAIRADPELASTPVMFLTAQAAAEARVESLGLGADDYLAKPFVEEELMARVRNLLKYRAQERELRELNKRLKARVEAQMGQLIRSGELSRFLPQTVVDSVLKGQIGSSDYFDRRRVTVLFADMVNFTALTDHLEPEELYELLNEYLREMTAVAVSYGGTVDKFIGDALMVVFGAPRVQEDRVQAIAAIQSALSMRQRVRELAVQWKRRGVQEELAVRIGINTGYATVGVFGSDLLRSYTAVGSPVNVASRLQAEGSAGDVLCGFSTYALVQDRVKVTALGAVNLRGMGHPIEAFRVDSVIDEDGREDSLVNPGA